MLDLGFTGSRTEYNGVQEAALRDFIISREVHVFRHGGCKGSDAAAVRLVWRLRADGLLIPSTKIIAYPGKSKTGDISDQDAGAIGLSDEVRETQRHFARNRNINRDCWELASTPKDEGEQDYGGTWFTIKDMRDVVRHPYHVFYPSGRTSAGGWNSGGHWQHDMATTGGGGRG